MENVPIWRYLTLAKYIDLLRTRSLYFPKAACFQDETEGKWWGHANLYQNAQRWSPSPANTEILEQLLARAGYNPAAILREINQTLPSANRWGWRHFTYCPPPYPDKRREYLESVIASWKNHYSNHNVAVQQWKSDLNVFRESTYISCWIVLPRCHWQCGKCMAAGVSLL